MEIDFIEQESDLSPMIRIFGRDPIGTRKLFDVVIVLSANISTEIALSELPEFRVNDLSLTLKTRARDEGVLQHTLAPAFEWILSGQSWRVVAGLVEPFLTQQHEPAHQWLAGPEARYGLERSQISVLLSTDGSW